MQPSDSPPSSPNADKKSAPAAAPTEPAGLSPEDFYLDGPYLVFTAAYHLKRGACCHSGCRHCPYGESPDLKSSPLEP
jgi:hypothetical protein